MKSNLIYNRFSSFDYPTKSVLLRIKWVFKNQELKTFCLKLNKHYSNFHTLEVVGRGGDTQLQVCENWIL